MLENQLAGWAVCARALRECLIGGKASVVSSLPRQRSMNLLQRPLPVTSQQSVPLAVANSDVATAERLFRAIVELVVGPAMIGTVIACLCDIEACNLCETVVAGSGALASRLGSKDHLRVNSFSRRRGRRIPRRSTSAPRREESSRAYLSKSCSASESTIAVCGRDRNGQAPVHGVPLRSAQKRH
jgi:hypothetical protein